MHTKGQEMLTRIVRGRWQERAVRKKDSMMIIKDSEKDSEILKETEHKREKEAKKGGSASLSESDHDTGMCDCSSLKSIIPTLDFS